MSEILKEFQAISQPSLDGLTVAFSKLGRLSRIGGGERVYEVAGENRKAVAYAINDNLSAIAFGWSETPSRIETIYWWNEFSFVRPPDYAIDLPEQGSVSAMLPKLMDMLKQQTAGAVEL